MNIGKSSNTIVPILGLFAVAAYRIIPSLTRIMNSVQNIKYSYPAIAPFISEFKDKESLTVLGEQKTTDNIIKFNFKLMNKLLLHLKQTVLFLLMHLLLVK